MEIQPRNGWWFCWRLLATYQEKKLLTTQSLLLTIRLQSAAKNLTMYQQHTKYLLATWPTTWKSIYVSTNNQKLVLTSTTYKLLPICEQPVNNLLIVIWCITQCFPISNHITSSLSVSLLCLKVVQGKTHGFLEGMTWSKMGKHYVMHLRSIVNLQTPPMTICSGPWKNIPTIIYSNNLLFAMYIL